ncbi:MAG: diguanylate cyclase [Rhodoferax sp.]|nr:diguanylate cyclase [Rhodoferax sp.]
METFVWGPDFTTGIDSVDHQHHGLVDLFNELSDTLASGHEIDEAQAYLVFQKLVAYAEHHFSEEEALMRRIGVDDRHVTQQQDLHHTFLEQLNAMWGAKETLSHPAEVFLTFLTSWLGLHILGIDQLMARQMRRIEAGESAEQAYEAETRPIDKSTDAMIKAMGAIYKVLSKLNLELSTVNRELEQRVLQRTFELEQTNHALVQANHKLEVYSHTDGLLNIANRKYFDQRLEEEWLRAIRSQQPVGLLMIDVDHFKRYNDTYGHQAGDACLRSVAKATSNVLARSTDLLARYGGEELVVVLPDTHVDGTYQVAQDICAAVSKLKIPHAGSDTAAYVTVSIGVASMNPPRVSSADRLVAAADQALYQAKKQGRNQVCRD